MKAPSYGLPCIVLVTQLFFCSSAAFGQQTGLHERPPKLLVTNVRRVFYNGEHNAFTDLIRFRGQLYLAFRSCPDGHSVHPTASIIILSSPDGREWHQIYRFSVKNRDTRDPHFLVFQERLFVYTGTWYTGESSLPRKDWDLNLHLGYAVWSEDGCTWHGPVLMEGTFGHYIWRANSFGEKAYLCARRKIGFAVGPKGEGREVESLMLESDDGLIWRKRAVFQEIDGDETAFIFEPDGTVIGVGRRTGTAQLLRSSAPYTEWRRSDLGVSVGGPLIAKWAGHYLVGGRHTATGREPKTVLWWLVGGKLEQCAELPSGGDNSYPGFVEMSPNRALLSYYSSHETDCNGKSLTAIYMAELTQTD